MPETPSPSTSGSPVVGYVLKMYPRFSETFIVSEILAREAQGERVVIFSLRPTTDSRFHPELARVAAPVIQVPRPSSAGRLWDILGRAVGGAEQDAVDGAADDAAHGSPDTAEPADPTLRARVLAELPELLQHPHDEAAQALAVALLARQHGVEHLHAHFASLATGVARLAGRIAGLPYSFTAHAKDIFHRDVDPRALQARLAEAHHAVTISGYNFAHLRRRFPESADRLALVRNGLELSRFPFTPDRPPAEVPRLLAVGRLVEKKGFGLLIEAVARLHARGIPVRAEIAGDGPLAEKLQRRIRAAGLEESVRLLGPLTQAEVAERLGVDDVFVAPFVVAEDGNADGLPTVLLEAMARGIRCVAADVTGVGEVVRSGETGWLVPSGDVESLTAAIAEAVSADDSSAEEHAALVRRARAQVEEQFDSARQAARLRRLVAGEAPEAAEAAESAEPVEPAGSAEPVDGGGLADAPPAAAPASPQPTVLEGEHR